MSPQGVGDSQEERRADTLQVARTNAELREAAGAKARLSDSIYLKCWEQEAHRHRKRPVLSRGV